MSKYTDEIDRLKQIHAERNVAAEEAQREHAALRRRFVENIIRAIRSQAGDPAFGGALVISGADTTVHGPDRFSVSIKDRARDATFELYGAISVPKPKSYDAVIAGSGPSIKLSLVTQFENCQTTYDPPEIRFADVDHVELDLMELLLGAIKQIVGLDARTKA
jgi:hypothetical protein